MNSGENDRFYREQAERFFADSRTVDLSVLRTRFLAALPTGARRLLDAGCGSGRDSHAFTALGYEVAAFDACPELVELARTQLGVMATVRRFEAVDELEAYDGIWACASLLHVAAAELPAVLDKLRRALRPGGLLYASFKYGDDERIRGRRTFTDYRPESAKRVFESVGFEIDSVWVSDDLRPPPAACRWTNLLVRRPKGAAPSGTG